MNSMIKLFRRLIEWLRMFFVILFEEEETRTPAPPSVQTTAQEKKELVQEKEVVQEKQEIAKPVELGISSNEKPLYKKSNSVLTYRERILLRTIRRAVAGDFTILMKVRMGDFVWLANEPQDRKFHNSQILCKHVDFLLCDKVTIEPLLVIELDDSSHKNYDHAERDRFKDETFDAVGIPYIRMQIQDQYDAGDLKKQIHEKIGDRPLFEFRK